MGFNIAVREAVFNKLKSYTLLVNKVNGIFDAVPQTQTECYEKTDKLFPYVTVGDSTLGEWDTFLKLGKDVTITINTWSRYRGRKETLEIQDLIYDSLHRQSDNMPVSGYHLSLCDEQGADSFVDADGKTYHGVQTFRILIEKE